MRIECDRCGKPVMHNESHMTDRQRGIVLRVLLSRMRQRLAEADQPRLSC